MSKQPPDYSQILQLQKTDPARSQELWQKLNAKEQLQAVLSAPDAKQKLELILLAKDSAALTQALNGNNFMRLVMDIGPEDSVELISMSSDEQLTHLLDLTGWDQEDFSPERYEAWLPLLLEAGPEKMVDWLKSTDMEVLALLGQHWFSVVKYIPSQEQQEPPDDLPEFTLDGVYFLEFRNPKLAAIVAQVLVVLKSELPQRYLDMIEAMRWEISSELNEFARRWRQGRLLDNGFPLRENALNLWALPKPEEYNWQNMPPKYASMHEDYPQGGYWQDLLPQDELLPQVITRLSRQDLEQLNQEMAYIANCGIVALNANPADARITWQAGREALSLVNLGLSILSEQDPVQAGAIITRMPLDALARHGAQAIRKLNNQAWTLMQEGWMKDLPTGLNLLDAPLDHWLAGILFKLPRYYDKGNKPEYRGFFTIGEINEAQEHLDEAVFWGKLMFELLGWQRLDMLAMLTAPAWPQDPAERKLSHILGTWLARRSLNLAPELAPLPQSQLKPAILALQKGFSGQWASQALASSKSLQNQRESALAGKLLSQAIQNLSNQLRYVNIEAEIDPAFITGLIIAQ